MRKCGGRGVEFGMGEELDLLQWQGGAISQPPPGREVLAYVALPHVTVLSDNEPARAGVSCSGKSRHSQLPA